MHQRGGAHAIYRGRALGPGAHDDVAEVACSYFIPCPAAPVHPFFFAQPRATWLSLAWEDLPDGQPPTGGATRRCSSCRRWEAPSNIHVVNRIFRSRERQYIDFIG